MSQFEKNLLGGLAVAASVASAEGQTDKADSLKRFDPSLYRIEHSADKPANDRKINAEKFLHNDTLLLAVANSLAPNKEHHPKEAEHFDNLSEAKKLRLAKRRISWLIFLVNKAKMDLVNHISSSTYLERLAKEFNVPLEVAKEHQRTRIRNIKDLSYDFESLKDIYKQSKGMAYYEPNENKVYFPYNSGDADDEDYRTMLHEILHLSTQSMQGLSDKLVEVFKESFRADSTIEDSALIAYYAKPQEFIVRKQILDLWLADLGLKKYGEKFTEAHYKKLAEMYDQGELPQDIVDLFEHIKAEKFVEMMNGLADVSNSKDYYHPGWDYRNNVDIS
jgi:hypothetical protein